MEPEMVITPKGERAKELFLSGYNCAQSVAGAFADEIGLPLERVLRLSQPFGAGFGRLREVCGTFSGMMFVVGELYGDALPNSENKAKIYGRVQELSARFRAANGAFLCRDILGPEFADTNPSSPSARTLEYYLSRPCPMVCARAASILEVWLAEQKEEKN